VKTQAIYKTNIMVSIMKGAMLSYLAIAQTAAFAPPSNLHKTLYSADTETLNKITNVAMPNAHRCPKASTTELSGIPKMFRWLTDQYPNINSRLNEGLGADKVVDNFYLDMNGIIHPCTHGNSDDIVILDETAMFKKIFGYVDR
jgi:hypothetical protein